MRSQLLSPGWTKLILGDKPKSNHHPSELWGKIEEEYCGIRISRIIDLYLANLHL